MPAWYAGDPGSISGGGKFTVCLQGEVLVCILIHYVPVLDPSHHLQGGTHSPGGEGVGGQYFGRRQPLDWPLIIISLRSERQACKADKQHHSADTDQAVTGYKREHHILQYEFEEKEKQFFWNCIKFKFRTQEEEELGVE